MSDMESSQWHVLLELDPVAAGRCVVRRVLRGPPFERMPKEQESP